MSNKTTPQPQAKNSGKGGFLGWIIRFIKGVVIALGFILPGVSGGVLAAILGIYERLLSFMAHLTKNFKANLLFFIPVGVGMVAGIVLLSNPLEYLLENFQVIVLWGFAGAIVGTLPSLFKESVSKKLKRDFIDYTWLIATMLIGGSFLFFMSELFGTIPDNFFGFLIAGVLLALGVLVPGLSPSNLLLILGLYNPMLNGFKSLDIVGVFLPIGIGALATILLFSKAMEFLINRFHSRVYHFIIGIVIASTVLILVPNPFMAAEDTISYVGADWLTFVLAAVLFIGGMCLGLWMSKLEEKYK
ncbi:MAG: DUF368 domain-containing protein [Oscillospiraceae bacterium]|nr:DUF368 domain-containing protein [Oscillospiraceae bacterium]